MFKFFLLFLFQQHQIILKLIYLNEFEFNFIEINYQTKTFQLLSM